MAMFDWNDEELTNIIWGEARESDDHVVPYPDQNEEKPLVLFGNFTKRETNQEISNVIPVEPKKPFINTGHGVELVSSPKCDIHDPSAGCSLDSWPDGSDPSIINYAKADQDSMGTAASNNAAKSLKSGFLRDETAQFNKDSDFFKNPPEDREQGDFIDYGWANIGSFDDLDRIFSNDDRILGDLSVGNVDEPWSSSNDVTRQTLLSGDSSDSPLGALRTSSDRSETEAQYKLDSSQSFISVYEKLNEIKSHAPHDVQTSTDTIEHSVGRSKLLAKEKTFEMVEKSQAYRKQLDDASAATLDEFPDKGNKQKKLLKGQKLEAKNEVRQLHDLYATWSSCATPFQQVVNNQYAPSMVNPCPPLVLSQQRQFQRPAPFQQKNFSGPLLASPLYGNMVYHYPAPSVLPQFLPVEGNHKLVNANSLKKSVDTAMKPPAMTPKEKIEKLRRRQQLRAILAIQKQQQQCHYQVPVVETSTMEGGNSEVYENFSCFPSLDQNSPIEHDDNNTVSMAFDNCSVEESVLHRLQDTISKLDIRIRLCIRDSLFRLAQSAIQRQCPSDTNSPNTCSRDNIPSNKDIDNHERFTRMHDVETDTNPIDRTVAHLLFHRPLEFSGKLAETPDSPVSANLSYERKANALKSLATGYFPENFENPQISSTRGSKTPLIYFEKDHSKNSPCLYTHENASNNEAADSGLMNVEAPKSI